MTNRCGHDRDVLLLALGDLAHLDNDLLVRLAQMPEALPEWRSAVLDLVDPAKLAEMLAACGRELGFAASEDALGIGDIAFSTEPDMPYVRLFRGYGRLVDNWYEWRDLDMPKARALLLQWLQLPDGAREEAERVLRGET